MILYFGDQEETVRALLDTGSTIPILSLDFTEKHQVPIVERATKRTIQDYAGQEVSRAGEYFTSPLLLQHRQHFTRVSFEVAPLAGDYDIILPCWWLAKHKCDLLASNGRIKFCNAVRPRPVYSWVAKPSSLMYIYYRSEDLPLVATILPTHHTVPYSTPQLFSHIPFLS